jgi:hypothetical protein
MNIILIVLLQVGPGNMWKKQVSIAPSTLKESTQ